MSNTVCQNIFPLHLCSTLWLEHIFLDIFSNLLCSISCFLDFFFEILFPKIISIFFVKNVVLSTFHFKELNHYNYFLFPKFVAKFLFQILLEFQNYLYWNLLVSNVSFAVFCIHLFIKYSSHKIIIYVFVYFIIYSFMGNLLYILIASLI